MCCWVLDVSLSRFSIWLANWNFLSQPDVCATHESFKPVLCVFSLAAQLLFEELRFVFVDYILACFYRGTLQEIITT